MKPFKLKPAFKDYIWGGDKLRTRYGKDTELSPVAESWELSCHKDGCSVISGGVYDGMALDEFIRSNPHVLGTSVRGGELPVLIKLIDAADNLSVQVHPNDEQAFAWEGEKGKTEMWYVIDADKDARITYGVAEDITSDELAAAISEKRVETLLNSVPSSKGDVFFVEAGTIHAIGKGNLIAEIQQNSNVTYRLYDYGRKDKNGKERELHIDKGVAAAVCKRTEPREITVCEEGVRLLGSCPYFVVREVALGGGKSFTADEKSYHALLVTDGEGEIICGDYKEKITAGETLFIPASSGEYTLMGRGTVLITTNV